jgi:hypothetical protein
LCKPFLRKGLLDIVHVHPAGPNFEEFFKNHIPKSHMPSDYGGDCDSLEVLNQKTADMLIKLKNYFILEEEHMKGNLDEEKD